MAHRLTAAEHRRRVESARLMWQRRRSESDPCDGVIITGGYVLRHKFWGSGVLAEMG